MKLPAMTKSLTKLDVCIFNYYFKSLTAISNKLKPKSSRIGWVGDWPFHALTIGSDNGLSPGRRQAIIWTNAGILLIRTLGTNFSEILGEIHSFSFSKMRLKMLSAKGRLFGLGINELM